MTYRGPDGSNESIANDTWDLWIGTTRELNEIAATTASQTLTDFKFLWTNGNATIDQDNFLITPIPAIPTSQAASLVNANDFQANWSTVSGVTGYSIDVATDAAFTSFVSGYNNLYVSGAGTSSVSVTGLTASTPYWYRVRGTSQYTVGSFSSGNSSSQNPTTGAGSSTSAAFTSASSSIGEAAGPASIGITITNPAPSATTSVTVTASGATGRIGSFTSPVVASAAATSVNLSVPISNNILCDGNQNVTFTITGVTGGQGSPTIGAQSTHTLTVNNDDACTNVSFAASSATVSEGVGTYNVVVNITDFSTTQATSVDVVLTSGSATRINNYTTQTVTFPANSGAAQTVTLTVTNNSLCDGDATLTFALQNLTGGQGTPTVGANRTLTITDNDTSVDLTATTANPINHTDFTANWNAISGATGYFLDVSAYSDFLDPATTNVVEWNFPTVGADPIADGGIPANAAKTISTVGGTSAITYAAVSGTTTARADTWNSGSGSKYWQVELVTTGYADLKLSSKQRSSSTGPRDFKVQYRIGVGGTWTDVTGATITTADNLTSGVLTNVSLPAACANQASVFLRWIMTSNTSVGGGTTASGGASNIDDIIITGRAPSYLVGHENQSVGNVLSQSITGLTMGFTYYYRVRSTGGCSSGNNSNVISVTTTQITAYYSRSSGDVDDDIWSDTPSGTPGPAAWTSLVSMNVQSGHTVTNTASVTFGDLYVDGTLVLANGSSMTVNGDEIVSTGTITAADNSLLELFGEDAIMTVAGTPSFFNVTVNNGSGILADEPFAIRGTLFIEAGDFETLSTVIMQSDATGTGRLGPVDGNFTGDITMQRYIPAGATNWRLMGSPVAGQTVNNWKDDFTTAGFPGSHVPGFDNPLGSGILWPSVRWYDETRLHANPDTGLVGVSSVSQSLAQGQGFAAWCGTSLATTTAFTVDMVGAPHIAASPISLPVTYSNSGNPGADGYNLVSNPLPSPVRWSLLSRTNVGGTMYIFNPAAGNTGSYTIGVGGTLGATDTIQSSQAFFVKANAASPSLQVEEADKVESRSYGGLFGGSQINLFSGIRLRVSSTINQFIDETMVAFNMGAPDLDEDDVTKIVFAHPDAPQISTRTESGVGLMVNAYGPYSIEIAIPVAVNVGLDGTYTITATNFENIGLSCLTLEDLATGTITPMSAGAEYSFTAGADDDEAEARFVLRATAPVPMIPDNASCFEANDGRGTVIHVGEAPLDITWTNAAGDIFLEQTIESGVAVTGDLTPGEYGVRVNSTGACGELTTTFTIEEPAELETLSTVMSATCNDENGLIDITVLGGTAPYTYAWSDGSDAEDRTVAAGDYALNITDAHGCAIAEQTFTVTADDAVQAEATAETNTVAVNTPVAFNTTVEEGTTISWNFGDETTSEEAAPAHSWGTPGTYTVTLTVDNGVCTDTWTTQVLVETSTGVTTAIAPAALNAWYANDKFVVEHNFNNGEAVLIDVLDATGRLHLSHKVAGVPARINIPADGLATGVWFLRFSNNGEQRTMRVPLVR